MSDKSEPVLVKEEPPKSLFALTRDGITFTDSHSAVDMRQGLALLQLAREAQIAQEAYDSAQENANHALALLGAAGERHHIARMAYVQALSEVTR